MSKFAILWLCCAMMTGALLFQTSQHVTDGRQRLENITAAMRSEEDTLRVLQAEWSYLNQPERLEKLSAQYLKLSPMKGRQFMAMADIPLRPAAPAAPALTEDVFAAADAPAAENMLANPETAVAATVIATPQRKPPGLRLPAAYAPPLQAGTTPQKPATAPIVQKTNTPPAVQNAAPATADNNPSRRSFFDVLDSLGSGGAR
jgi:hypothetical protein